MNTSAQKILDDKSKDKFIYETHLHTSEGSACGRSKGADIARAYKAAGYTGIIITDHFFYGNTAVDRGLPWAEWVEGFCKGYENALCEGSKIGLQVFFGWEAGYRGTEFLIYGLDKAWLLSHPEIRDADIPTQYALVHASGGIVVHAHPFREAPYIPEIRLYPEYVDGVEAVNATHSGTMSKNRSMGHPEFNERAVSYADEHNLAKTAGSDQHSTEMVYGGMVFNRRLDDINDFVHAVLQGEAVSLLDGTRKPF